jgi:DNA-binding CsgD family transcriptional regulator
MPTTMIDRTLASTIGAIAVFNTVASLTRPEVAHRPAPGRVVVWLVLLLLQAVAYWNSESLRRRVGAIAYLAAHATIIFVIGVTGALFPIGLALLCALTAYTIMLAGDRWNSALITLGAILLFTITAVAASSIYQGATAGLILAATGLVAHALAALVRQRRVAPVAAVSSEPVAVPRPGGGDDDVNRRLTDREREVLDVLVTGARTSEIATRLGISDRTVKAHLASIYQKLGVTSRGEAIAAALAVARGGAAPTARSTQQAPRN